MGGCVIRRGEACVPIAARRKHDGNWTLTCQLTPRRRDSDRISSAAQRDPDSPTATGGFEDRAQAAADSNEPQDPYDYDDYDIE